MASAPEGRVSRTAALLALLLVLPASGCGFTPLYARPGVVDGLNRIALETPKTRTGHLLREELEDQLAIDRSQAPVWRLSVKLEEQRRARGRNVDDTASRYELKVSVSYVLARLDTGEVTLDRSRPIFITADATNQPYAGIAAQQDSEARAAAEAAELIRTDIATVLKGK